MFADHFFIQGQAVGGNGNLNSGFWYSNVVFARHSMDGDRLIRITGSANDSLKYRFAITNQGSQKGRQTTLTRLICFAIPVGTVRTSN